MFAATSRVPFEIVFRGCGAGAVVFSCKLFVEPCGEMLDVKGLKSSKFCVLAKLLLLLASWNDTLRLYPDFLESAPAAGLVLSKALLGDMGVASPPS